MVGSVRVDRLASRQVCETQPCRVTTADQAMSLHINGQKRRLLPIAPGLTRTGGTGCI
jgi:hypothetical protein